MKVTFWLLDINSESKSNVPELWMWGIDSHGNRVLVVDRNFVDYFYAVIEEDYDPAKIEEEIKKAHGKCGKTEKAVRTMLVTQRLPRPCKERRGSQ